MLHLSWKSISVSESSKSELIFSLLFAPILVTSFFKGREYLFIIYLYLVTAVLFSSDNCVLSVSLCSVTISCWHMLRCGHLILNIFFWFANLQFFPQEQHFNFLCFSVFSSFIFTEKERETRW